MTSRRQRILAKQQARDVLNSETDNDGYDTPTSDTDADEAKALKVIEQYHLNPEISKTDRKLLKGAIMDSKKREKKTKKAASKQAQTDLKLHDSDEEDDIVLHQMVFAQKEVAKNKTEEEKNKKEILDQSLY